MNKQTLDKFTPKAIAEIIRLEKRLIKVEEEIKLVDEMIDEVNKVDGMI